MCDFCDLIDELHGEQIAMLEEADAAGELDTCLEFLVADITATLHVLLAAGPETRTFLAEVLNEKLSPALSSAILRYKNK